MTDYLIFKDLDGKYITLPDYIEEAKKTSLQKKRQRVQKQRAMKQQMPRMVRMLIMQTRKKNRQRYTTQQICSSRASMSICSRSRD